MSVCLSVRGTARGVSGNPGTADFLGAVGSAGALPAPLDSSGWGTALQTGSCLGRLWGCPSGASTPDQPRGAGESRSGQ